MLTDSYILREAENSGLVKTCESQEYIVLLQPKVEKVKFLDYELKTFSFDDLILKQGVEKQVKL